MAMSLRDLGHRVTILCSHPLYPKWKTEKSNLQIPGINIVRGGLKIHYPKQTLIRRMVLEVWFSLFTLKKILPKRTQYDIIIPVFPPSLAFYIIHRFIDKRIKTVGIVHDLQEVYSMKKKSLVYRFIGYFINRIEKVNFMTCKKLIFLSSEMKETAKNIYGLNKNKLEVQYPFVSKKNKILTNDLTQIIDENKINIVYSGALGEKQNPEDLYDFFDFASQKLPNCYFYFFSQGHLFEKIKENNFNPKIKFYDLVKNENLDELYSKSTIQIVPQLAGTSKGSLPSKLPNILASRCQVLAITDKNSEIEKIFKKYDFHEAITSWNQDKMLQAIKKLLDIKDHKIDARIELAEEIFNIDSLIHKILH